MGVRSALVADANRRRRAQQQVEAQPDRQVVNVHNAVVAALAELPDPRIALAVTERIAKSIREFLASQ